MIGFVSLVGAGPGDPDLLTLKAARRLRKADLVLYDALVSQEVLCLAAGAQRVLVGRRARKAGLTQDAVNRLMIRHARGGKHVVRLKAGDPFVLGRGGEEALALWAASVPFEIVPGVTAAVAAPALAGIPVTHRGLASGFAVVSGHAESAYRPILETIKPGSLTLVILMGLLSRQTLAHLLLERGWARETPAAILLAASCRQSSTWIGTLDELAQASVERSSDAPGTIVVGQVVSLASVIGLGLGENSNVEKREASRAGHC